MLSDLPQWDHRRHESTRQRPRGRYWLSSAAAVVLGLTTTATSAATIANPVAAFSGLDKITGRLINFDVYIDETVQFGALQITPRACYTRPPTETQRTTVFVEVDQVSLQQTVRRIFTGWMFADSPALNAIDHAVYDIWLVDCKQTTGVPPPDARSEEDAAEAPALQPEPEPEEPAEETAAATEADVVAEEVAPSPSPSGEPQPAPTEQLPSFVTLR